MSECCAFYRGKVYFGPNVATLRHIGNVSRLVLTPVRDTLLPLDAALNASCCLYIACGIDLTFSCMEYENLAIALGSSYTSAGGTTIHSVGQQCNGMGRLRFVGENAFGGTITVDVPKVELNTTDTINLISSAVEQISLSGRVILSESAWFTVTTTAAETC